MDKFKINELLNYISPKLRTILHKSNIQWNTAEEIYIAVNKPVSVFYNGRFEYVMHEDKPFICDKQIIDETLLLMTENSMYAANEKLTNGFITLKGGHRAGVCGTAVFKDNKMTAVKDISSVNIRIARELIGSADKIIHKICNNDLIHNTLIISPPGCGKTTLLRDVSRLLGKSHKVSVVDERSEIAAMYSGVAQNDVGIQTSVLNDCPKSIGIPIVIRSMAPEVIITDEIGAKGDVEAVEYAALSGVHIITSAHGANIDDLKRKENFKKILNFFDLFITLSSQGGTGSICEIRENYEHNI